MTVIYKMYRFLLPVMIVLVSLSCFKRDNPWDPINGCHASVLREIQQEYRSRIDSVFDGISSLDASITKARTTVSGVANQYDLNATLLDNFDKSKTIVETIKKEDPHLEICDKMDETLTPCTHLTRIDTSTCTDILDNIRRCVQQLISDSLAVATLLEVAEQSCSRRTVFSEEYRDSTISVFNKRLSSWDDLENNAVHYDSMIKTNDLRIDSINQAIDSVNAFMVRYQKSCSDTDTVKVPRFEDLIPGGSFSFSDSVVEIEFFQVKDFNPDNGEETWTRINGNETTLTRIISKSAETSRSSYIHYKNFIFDNLEYGVGARVIDTSSNIIFENCIFRKNHKWGFEVSGGCRDIKLINCIFTCNGLATDTNGAGGIRIAESRNITADNVLVANNEQRGIEIFASSVAMINATVSDNDSDGINFIGVEAPDSLDVQYSIISFNKKFGIYRNAKGTHTPGINFTDVWFFRNDAGTAGGDTSFMTENAGDFSENDPMYEGRAPCENDEVSCDEAAECFVGKKNFYTADAPYSGSNNKMGFQYH